MFSTSLQPAPKPWCTLIALLMVLGLPTQAVCLSAYVLWVTDGYTLTVIDQDFQLQRIRVYGIDCPESDQEYGFTARLKTAWETWGRPVTAHPVDKDDYGRQVARVQRKDEDLSAQLIASGLAWVYDRYCQQAICRQWVDMERKARRKGLGLWNNPDPIPPWMWRRGKRPDNGWRWW